MEKHIKLEPDLALVKTEVFDCEESGETPQIEAVYSNYNHDDHPPSSEFGHVEINTADSTSCLGDQQQQYGVKLPILVDTRSLYKQRDIKEEYGASSLVSSTEPFFGNKIILGTKRKEEVRAKIPQYLNAQLPLVNHHYYLSRNCNFCKICLTLFPNNNTFDDHYLKYHCISDGDDDDKDNSKNIASRRVQLKRNCKTDDAAEEDVQKKRTKADVARGDGKTFKCTLCNHAFVNKKDLEDHLFEHVKKTFAATQHASRANRNRAEDTRCRLCDKNFKSVLSLRNHGYFHVTRGHIAHKNEITNCNKSNATIKTVPKRRRPKAPQTLKAMFVPNFRCKLCHTNYFTKSGLKKHLVVRHEITGNIEPYTIQLNTHHKLKHHSTNTTTDKPDSRATAEDRSEPSGTRSAGDLVKIIPDVVFKCKVCKVHYFNNTAAVNHSEHKKENVQCKLCQRTFDASGYRYHEEQHGAGLNVRVLPASEALSRQILKRCPKCDVHFRKEKMLTHIKNCNGNFDQKQYCKRCKVYVPGWSFNSHVQFHLKLKNIIINYVMVRKKRIESDDGEREVGSVLMKNYNNITMTWNILYRCNDCDVIVDNYTSAVEHCHDHILNEDASASTTKCNLCGFDIEDECYARHYELHLKNSHLNREFFTELMFDHRMFTRSDWLRALFGADCRDTDIYVKDSVYKNIRNLKLDVVKEGPEAAIYLCRTCKAWLSVEYLKDHVRSNCESRPDIDCFVCPVTFADVRAASAHVCFKSYKIIGFNRADDLDDNKKLLHVVSDTHKLLKRCEKCRTVMEEGDVDGHRAGDCLASAAERKKCPHCDHYFSDAYYDRHVAEHNIHHFEIEAADAKSVAARSEYVIYRCNDCGRCTAKDSSDIHNCVLNTTTRRCKPCKLLFSTCGYRDHLKNHKTASDFHINNIRVVGFDSKSRNGRLYQCVECKETYCCKKPAAAHMRRGCRGTLVECPLCHYLFREKSLAHERMHRDGLPLDRFELVRFDDKRFLTDCRRIDMTHYECGKCGCYTHARDVVSKHMAACTGDTPSTRCDKCDIRIISDYYEQHLKLHAQCTNLNRHALTLSTVRPETEREKEKPKYTFYVCRSCGVGYYGSKRTRLEQHKEYYCRKIKRFCNICKLCVPKTHSRLHARFKNLNKDNIVVRYFNGSQITLAHLTVDEHLNSIQKRVARKKSHSNAKSGKEGRLVLYECPDCALFYAREGSVADHVCGRDAERAIECSSCERTYANEAEYMHHARQLHALGRRSVVRIISNKTSKNRRLYECRACGMCFVTLSTKQSHKSENKCGTRRTHACDLCGRKFSKVSLRKHKLLHHRNRQHNEN